MDPVGTIYSWTTTHRAPTPEFAHLVPYTIVVVALDEPHRIRLLGRLAPTNEAPSLRVGLRVQGTRERSAEGVPLLVWNIIA
ncbi:Zn-ribbon domain-containing OB-fold protein [Arthrobacter sp. B6]|uniref:Zn-ribbon domain-containing OB-fold protein n=1 Tax=Arthrobacter sp. B6 TaxID=1570137 RepID=UPI001E44199E|nr:OB-fold domain-containing protein [Arthrobacter sp. B6]